MKQPSFFDNVREFIAGIAWSVYLWASRMTEEDFFEEHRKQAIEQIRDNNGCTCGSKDDHHTVECYLGL